MMKWFFDNMDWLFSGIGTTILGFLFGSIKRTSSFRLTHNFYIVLLFGLLASFGIDCLFLRQAYWSLRVFLYGLIIVMAFLLYKIIEDIQIKFKVKESVKRLTIEECFYVEKCYNEEVYTEYSVKGKDPIPYKMENILYVPTGDRIIINKPYQICVYQYAYKLVKKRLDDKK